jgi:hypothetical protein
MRTTRLALATLLLASPVWAWGPLGHELIARAALEAAGTLPPWFREAGDSLAQLANAPDRWKDEEGAVPALAARRADHFFDLDVWGAGPLPADRWAYVARAGQRRLRAVEIGFLPYAIAEEYGILVSAFRDVRADRAGGRAAAVDSAGVLAHLAGDAAVPLHVTRHHHGWIGANPERFTRDPGIHRWFESDLVAHLAPIRLRPEDAAAPPLVDVPAGVRALLEESLARVPELYRLEKQGARGRLPAENLARERLIAGARLTARLWQAAWRASQPVAQSAQHLRGRSP